MMAGADTPRHACRHSQRAAEKSLKAAFVLEGVDFPHIRDLDKLRNLLPAGWSVQETHRDLAKTTRYVIISRHPGIAPELNGADASHVVSVAGEMCGSIEAEFGHRGVP